MESHAFKIGVRQRTWGKWVAEIRESVDKTKHMSRRLWLGTFPTALEAAFAYDEAAKAMYGSSAILNFPTNQISTNSDGLKASCSGENGVASGMPLFKEYKEILGIDYWQDVMMEPFEIMKNDYCDDKCEIKLGGRWVCMEEMTLVNSTHYVNKNPYSFQIQHQIQQMFIPNEAVQHQRSDKKKAKESSRRCSWRDSSWVEGLLISTRNHSIVATLLASNTQFIKIVKVMGNEGVHFINVALPTNLITV
ncbi:hypothetical protein V2J09_010110 [Rumex salicifolius]